MNPLLQLVSLLLTDVVPGLIAKFKAENPDPNATDASALAGLKTELGNLRSSITELEQVSSGSD